MDVWKYGILKNLYKIVKLKEIIRKWGKYEDKRTNERT